MLTDGFSDHPCAVGGNERPSVIIQILKHIATDAHQKRFFVTPGPGSDASTRVVFSFVLLWNIIGGLELRFKFVGRKAVHVLANISTLHPTKNSDR